jgi:hypothetical protein
MIMNGELKAIWQDAVVTKFTKPLRTVGARGSVAG